MPALAAARLWLMIAARSRKIIGRGCPERRALYWITPGKVDAQGKTALLQGA
jgi:hypothetical protein